ncbi:MAG: Gfo/Idh/MocA family oxidoreductase [Marinilabiliaceae bacterium]|nr:Gfo/Idh/MocA family oxidoreductase [Marinilabiliaceae bacterium]
MIKFAIIGLGNIGKRHAEIILENINAEITAVCDILPANKTFWQYPQIPYFSSIDNLMNSRLPIDVVSICTPNGLHAAQAIEALSNNFHVVIEKPMALTKVEAETIIFKAFQVSKQVFVVMQNRYSPPIKWLKQLINKKILGRILMVHLNCFWNRDDRYYQKGGWHGTLNMDGGTLFTQFSHFIDIMYWLFGDIKNIRASIRNFVHKHSTHFEDCGSVVFEFVNSGGIGTLNFSTAVWNQNMESSITVIGENGALKIGGQYMDNVEYCHIKDYKMPKLKPVNPPNDYGSYKGSASNHGYVIDNVIKTLNSEAEVGTNALEGLKVVEIIERIYKA